MALFRLLEADERSIMKCLLEYILSASVSSAGTVNHHFDSTWGQICRFLLHFDPQGQVAEGYRATMTQSQIISEVDLRTVAELPSIEVFLDVALCLNNHLHGIGAQALHDRMTFEPKLQKILITLGLLDHQGKASEPLLLDAIGRWNFFDFATNELTVEANTFLEDVAQNTWEKAQQHDRDYLKANLRNGVHVDGWFAKRWHLGLWLKGDEEFRFSELFGNHSALDWLVPLYIKRGLKDGKNAGRASCSSNDRYAR